MFLFIKFRHKYSKFLPKIQQWGWNFSAFRAGKGFLTALFVVF